jgi:hypothetical protein
VVPEFSQPVESKKKLEDLKDELSAPANLFTAAFDVADEAGCAD